MAGEAIAIVAVAVLGGAVVQGATGIGFALLVVPVVGIVDPLLLPLAVLIPMMPLNAVVAWRERTSIDLRGVGWTSVARIPATPIGVWLLAAVSERQLGLLIGALTVVAAAASLLAPAFTPNRTSLLVAGGVTGLSETASGIGGPPYALAYQHRPAPELRATVALCFLIGQVVSILGLAVGGQLTGPGIGAGLWFVPVTLAGVLLSSRLHHRVGGRGLRLGILVFALVSGGFMVLRAATGGV